MIATTSTYTPSDFMLVYCTTPSEQVAEQIASVLVESGLAACVSIMPQVCSIYRWQGQIHRDNEVQMQIKTTYLHYPELESKIRQLHPYEVPEVIAVSLTAGSPAYLDWLQRETVKPTLKEGNLA